MRLLVDDLERAEQIAAISASAAIRSKIPTLSVAADKRLKEVRDLRKAFDGYKAAVIVRNDQPDDPKACLDVGRYLCLGRGDWDARASSFLPRAAISGSKRSPRKI